MKVFLKIVAYLILIASISANFIVWFAENNGTIVIKIVAMIDCFFIGVMSMLYILKEKDL